MGVVHEVGVLRPRGPLAAGSAEDGNFNEEEQWDVDNAHIDVSQYRAFGCLPPLMAGYALCLLVLVEAIFVLLHSTGTITKEHSWFQGLDPDNPFANFQTKLLNALGMGDLLAAGAGAFALYMSENRLVQMLGIRKNHESICSATIGSMFIWRILVALTTAPCVGVILAYEPHDADKTPIILRTFAYLAINVPILWTMMIVYRVTADGGQAMQRSIDEEMFDERRQLILQAYAVGHEPDSPLVSPVDSEILFCLPMDVAVAAYMLVCLVLSLMWCCRGLWSHQTIGGWMFPLAAPPLPIAWLLEQMVYVYSAAVAFIGLMGFVFFRGACEQEAMAVMHLQGRPAYSDDLEDAVKNKRRALFLMLGSFVAGVLRFGLFIPLTGMSLISADVCGFYVRSLAATSLKVAAVPAPLHCTGQDYFTLVVVLSVMAVDAYFIWGTFRLWRYYRIASGLGATKAGLPAYGAMKSVDVAGQPQSFASARESGSFKELVL